MDKAQVRERIRQIGVIPAVRVASAAEARFAVEAVAEGGITVVEITMTVPGALDVIVDLAKSEPDIVVGAGTVLDSDTALRCMDAGAKFITSPGLKPAVIDTVRQHGVVSIPGALTPTEVEVAWESGCDLVKVYPCSALGGPAYIRWLKHPFPDVPLIAAGGVSQSTASEFILSGATAVGIGASLISKDTIEYHQGKRIRELARRYLHLIEDARAELRAREERRRERYLPACYESTR